MTGLRVVEICAGAGGQALGLELAGFEHELAVELDVNAANTLKANRPQWKVAVGDVADKAVWDPAGFGGISLLAGGVPCPPFSIAGKQLGATDERDLFAWAVEQVNVIRPRAVLLENVRGLSTPRFAAYRERVRQRLQDFGYWSQWRLLHAADYGVPQLRPRFVLVAMTEEDSPWFSWPEPHRTSETVGTALGAMMAAGGWKGATAWARRASTIAPTIVGGSKKHGGADLGPTRAKRAWAELGVDGLGIANGPPTRRDPVDFVPKLTTDMVARLQGWMGTPQYAWTFTGLKTTRYRQVGNAFPPPVARAVGTAIRAAIEHEGERVTLVDVREEIIHDPVYTALRALDRYATQEEILHAAHTPVSDEAFHRRIRHLAHDFVLEQRDGEHGRLYRIADFRGFTGQQDHERHTKFEQLRAQIS